MNTLSINPKAYKKPSVLKIKQQLSTEEYTVTQQAGTERAFSGKYWNKKDRGIYVDIVTGEPLFMSSDKFDSDCGWPSFTQAIAKDVIIERTDIKYGMVRTEVRSRVGDSHLGHVFTDGPSNDGGLRYCINSASLRFIAYEDMDREGYGNFKKLIN